MKAIAITISSLLRLFQQPKPGKMSSFIDRGACTSAVDKKAGSNKHAHNISLINLRKGESGVVDHLVTTDSKNLQKLLAMGILPGRNVSVLQTYPAYILQIDRTQAAMDRQLAEKIGVKTNGKR